MILPKEEQAEVITIGGLYGTVDESRYWKAVVLDVDSVYLTFMRLTAIKTVLPLTEGNHSSCRKLMSVEMSEGQLLKNKIATLQ